MNNEEVNRTIAEFEYTKENGFVNKLNRENKIEHSVCVEKYTKSLDALIPIWEELKERGVWLNSLGNRKFNHFSIFSEKCLKEYTPFSPFNFYEHSGCSVTTSAAYATAKAIKGLK